LADDRKKFKSQRGVAHWPSLNRTESYKGKDTGNYTLKLILEGAALEATKAEVEEFLVDTYGPKKAKLAASPFKLTKPKEGSGDKPKTFITFRMKAVGKDGDPRNVALYDAKGNPVKRKVNLGSGSVVKVNGTMSAFKEDPGVAFYMNSVQIIKLVEYQSADGFDAVEDEDGWSGDEFDAEATDEDADDSDGSAEDQVEAKKTTTTHKKRDF
jgi:hypothetical protein